MGIWDPQNKMTQVIIFAASAALVVVLALVTSLLRGRGAREQAAHTVAGRGVSGFVNTFGVCAVAMASMAFTLLPSFTLTYGVFGGLVWGGALAILGVLLYGLLFAGFIRRTGAQTLPEYLDMRFGVQLRQFTASLGIVGLLGVLAINVQVIARSLWYAFGFQPLVSYAVVLLVVLAITYSTGLAGASAGDFILMIVCGAALLAVTGLLIYQFGPPQDVMQYWPGGQGAAFWNGISGGALPRLFPAASSVLGLCVTFGVATLWGNNMYWQRAASCRTEKSARGSFIAAAAVLLAVFFVPLVLVGLYTGALYSTSFSLLGGGWAESEAFVFLTHTLFSLFTGILIMGLTAAGIAAATNAALAASAVSMRDLYRRPDNKNLYGGKKGKIDASRLVTLLICVVAYIVCVVPRFAYNLYAFSACFFVPAAVVFALGAFWPRFGKRGAFAGLVAGMVPMLVLTLLESLNLMSISTVLDISLVGVVFSLLFAVPVGLVETPPYNAAKGWVLTPGAGNRKDVRLGSTDKQVLSLIAAGYDHMSDVTDYLGVDSSTAAASVARLDKGGYIVRAGRSYLGFYQFSLSDKGAALAGNAPAKGLTPEHMAFLRALDGGKATYVAYLKEHEMTLLHKAAILDVLQRQGYVTDRAAFGRKPRLSPAGARAVSLDRPGGEPAAGPPAAPAETPAQAAAQANISAEDILSELSAAAPANVAPTAQTVEPAEAPAAPGADEKTDS